MEDRDHGNPDIRDPVEKLVRKTANDRHPSITVDDGIGFGLANHASHARVQTSNEICPQSTPKRPNGRNSNGIVSTTPKRESRHNGLVGGDLGSVVTADDPFGAGYDEVF